MRYPLVFVLLLTSMSAMVFGAPEVKFRGSMGFADQSDKIVEYELVKDGKRLVILGEKSLQVWNVADLKLIKSIRHTIEQFAPSGVFSKYLLLGIPKIFAWQPFLIDPNGKWIATIEKVKDPKVNTIIIRDLTNLDKIAELSVDGFGARSVAYDEAHDLIYTEFSRDKDNVFAKWDPKTFSKVTSLSVKDYKWHQEIADGKKAIVGAGDSKFVLNMKFGDSLRLVDIASGNVEREFTADGLVPATSYQDVAVLDNEKVLMASRNDRLFVWDLNGNGKPRFEIPIGNPKDTYKFKRVVNDRFIYVVKDNDGGIALFDILGDGKPAFEALPSTVKTSVDLADMSADNRYVAVSEPEFVKVFKLGDQTPVLSVVRDSPKERLRNIAFVDELGVFGVGRVNNSEKQPFRTQLHELDTFKRTDFVRYSVDPWYKLILNNTYFFATETGSAYVIDPKNDSTKRFSIVTYTTSCSSNDNNCTPSTANGQSVKLNNDEHLLLITGSGFDTVYNTVSGDTVASLFSPELARYDKKGRLRKSGLDESKWSPDGSFIFAATSEGFWATKRQVLVWDVSR